MAAAAAAASPSPAPRANSSETPAAATPTLFRAEIPTKTLRGLNKPKCIQCGNVARSRCPFQCCKSCCYKAQNPCHIHVLKLSVPLPEKPPLPPTTTTPVSEQQTTELLSPPVISHRVISRPQLHINAYNSLLTAIRSRKPLNQKEAVAINEWRFSKLREYKEKNIEVEDEAFDRYMKNVNLLEDVFSVKSVLDCSTENGSLSSNAGHSSSEADAKKIVSAQKLKLRSNPVRSENLRKRIRQIVDEGLRNLQKLECGDVVSVLNDQSELDERCKTNKTCWAKRASSLSELIDKLNRTRNEEDLRSCMEMKVQMYRGQSKPSAAESKDFDISKEESTPNILAPRKGLDYLSPKPFTRVEIDQEALNSINLHFFSLEKIEDL